MFGLSKNKIEFEKVSFGQFVKDCKKIFGKDLPSGFVESAYAAIKLPERSSEGSAGYDLSTPFGFALTESGKTTAVIPLGIRVKMPKRICFEILPRSGVGFKYGVSLANTVGLIDSDYYYTDNEGHIMAKLVRGFEDSLFVSGDRIAQGVFLKYSLKSGDKVKKKRKGGFGSSGK